jgi:predicted deacetylase
MGSMDARLLVSLSGIGPGTLRDCADLASELDRRKVPLSVLFAPSGEHAVLDWVRERTRRGDSLLLHGYDHRVTPGHRINLGRRAEFAALPAHEARLRLIAATAALDHAGLTAEGFAPPRWLGSRGTQQALRELGFRLCADLTAVHDLSTTTVFRARVQEFVTGGRRTETVRCFALVLAAARAARRGGLVRLGMTATDLVKPGPRQAFLDAIDVAVENGAVAATYAGLVASPRGATSTSVPSGARLVNNP